MRSRATFRNPSEAFLIPGESFRNLFFGFRWTKIGSNGLGAAGTEMEVLAGRAIAVHKVDFRLDCKNTRAAFPDHRLLPWAESRAPRRG